MNEQRIRHDAAFERWVAECVVRSVDGIALHEMREAPDADLVCANGQRVGLEIVRPVDQQSLDSRKRIAQAATFVENALRMREVCGAFSVYFELDSIAPRANASSHRAWLLDAAERLAAFLQTCSAWQIDGAELRSAGIEGVGSVEVRESPETLVIPAWTSRTPPGRTLVDVCLEKKHKKLATYRAANGNRFSEYWLAIASLAPGTVEDGGFSMLLEKRFKTSYDRVFLIVSNGRPGSERAEDVTPG